MSKKINAIRGMHDVLPADVHAWQWLEDTTRQLLQGYGYQEIRMPIVEQTDLFCRSIGEVTDIVEKEMYTFEDRNGDSLTLRPEGTASCVRACMQHSLINQQTQRLWYAGPMFRHERPQKGRYRQFHQIGVEAYGFPGPDLDAEQIMMTARLWRELGIADRVSLEINTLGRPHERAAHRTALQEYFRQHHDQLDEDSKRRLESNPLRILDTKNPDMKGLVADAPSLSTYLEDESQSHFDAVCQQLRAAGIDFTVNPLLVRGLDYYTNTVFEWVTEDLGAQATVCAGGRYDGLVEQLGGKPTVAVGFAMGIERLLALAEIASSTPEAGTVHAYLVMVGDAAQAHGLSIAERLRDAVPGLVLISNAGAGSFKAQFKRADKSQAQLALVLGEDEINNGVIAVKPLRDADAQQQTLSEAELSNYLNKLVVDQL